MNWCSIDVLLDAVPHFMHGLLIKCDIEPRCFEFACSDECAQANFPRTDQLKVIQFRNRNTGLTE
jgi:hypothetical protein